MTRGQAIKSFCGECVSGGNQRDCEMKRCPLYRYRMGREDKGAPGSRMIRSEAIRAFCRSCVCGSGKSVVRLCVSPECPLYPYRTHTTPIVNA